MALPPRRFTCPGFRVRGRRTRIADGIPVGGVDIGGLTPAQARARLNRVYAPRFNRPVVAAIGRPRWVLVPRAARVQVDVDATVGEALRRSRNGTIFGRV